MLRSLSMMVSTLRFSAGLVIVSLLVSAFPAAFFVAEAAADVTIFADGFESTPGFPNWSAADTVWQNSSSEVRTGTRGAQVSGNAQGVDYLTKAISTVGYENIALSFWYKTGTGNDGSPDSGDSLAAEWYDGTTWQPIIAFAGANGAGDEVTVWTQYATVLPAGANANAAFALRLAANVNTGNDKYYVDDVRLSGDDVVVPPPPKDTETIVVTGNTAAGENQPGWLFNRDASTDTPIEFNADEAVIGDGALNVLPIGATAADKFVGEYFFLGEMATLDSFAYDFKIGAGGEAADAGQFYLNVYANFPSSSPTKFYDCRYNVVPTTGSTGSFTTVTFDPTQAYPVTTHGTSPAACPAVPADMGDDAVIRLFALNLGDTSTSDVGLDGYFDHVVVETSAMVTTFDFEPVPTCTLTFSSDEVDYVVEKNVLAKALTFVHGAWLQAIPGSVADWIWGDNPVADPTVTEVQTFVKKFNWTGGTPTSAVLKVASDNGHVVTLGDFSATTTVGDTFASTASYDVAGAIVAGQNTLSIAVTNTGTPGNPDPTANPAGLIYELKVTGVGASCGAVVPTTPTVLPRVATLDITAPAENNDEVTGTYDFTAEYIDNDETVDQINWAIRAGTCAAQTNTVAGNVDGFTNPSSFVAGDFTATLNTALWTPGTYCFVVNPSEQEGEEDLRATRLFVIPEPPTSTVTMCKYDTQEQPRAGWRVMLLGDKVETVAVPATVPGGASTVAVLATGTGYVAVANGTWTNQSGANVVDAEYSSADTWTTVMDGYTGYQTDILELQINNEFDPASDWGAYNSNHRYAQAFTMAAPGTANFRIFDGTGVAVNESWYADNAGSLAVDVYPGYMGVTGENGCVTFTDVPYGTYAVDEIMQDGWAASEVPATVTVDAVAETVNLVNRDLAYLPPCELTIVSDAGTVVEETNTYAVPTYEHDDWTATIPGATWVWETATVTDPETATTRTFMETFTVATPTSAVVEIAADNGYLLYVNGTLVADRSLPTYVNNFQTHTQNDYDIMSFLQSGTNTMKVVVTNEGVPNANYLQNPAGVLYRLEVAGATGCARTTAVVPPVETEEYQLSGYKWNDANGDGVWDQKGTEEVPGESTLPGWQITLTSGTTTQTVTTDANGFYSVMVPAGTWTVAEVMQSGWMQTGTRQFGEAVETATCTFTLGMTEDIMESESESATCDFGNQMTPTIEDEDDNDNDGGGSSGTRVGRRAPQGQVLGASTTALQCSLYLEDYLRQTFVNDGEQVMKLQIFLNAVGIVVPVTQVFDATTDAAVRQFQAQYFTDVLTPWGLLGPTGYVYKTTRWKINNIVCPGSEAFPAVLN